MLEGCPDELGMILHRTHHVEPHQRELFDGSPGLRPFCVVGIGREDGHFRVHSDETRGISNGAGVDPRGLELDCQGLWRQDRGRVRAAGVVDDRLKVRCVSREGRFSRERWPTLLATQEVGVHVVDRNPVVDQRVLLGQQHAVPAGLTELANVISLRRPQRHSEVGARCVWNQASFVVGRRRHRKDCGSLKDETAILGRGQPQEHLRAPLVEVADIGSATAIGVVGHETHAGGRLDGATSGHAARFEPAAERGRLEGTGCRRTGDGCCRRFRFNRDAGSRGFGFEVTGLGAARGKRERTKGNTQGWRRRFHQVLLDRLRSYGQRRST